MTNLQQMALLAAELKFTCTIGAVTAVLLLICCAATIFNNRKPMTLTPAEQTLLDALTPGRKVWLE